MAEDHDKQPARAVFSEAARARLPYDEPVTATDPDTGIRLLYRPADGTLTLYDGPLGDRAVVAPCAEADLESTARHWLGRLPERRP